MHDIAEQVEAFCNNIARWLDWCRESTKPYKLPVNEHVRWSMATAERGVAFGEACSKITREEISAWAYKRAALGRDRRHVDGDWTSFCNTFQLRDHDMLPDRGSIMCSLHYLADAAAGIRNVHYGY